MGTLHLCDSFQAKRSVDEVYLRVTFILERMGQYE